MADSLRLRIQEDMKATMRARNAERLGTIRLLLAAIKQREVDERITLDDVQILSVIDKMIRQRNDSVEQYTTAKRQDLVDKENSEILVLKEYLPAQLTENEIEALIKDAIKIVDAHSIKDMAKVMAHIKNEAQGKTDMGMVSAKIKAILTNVKTDPTTIH